MAEEEHISSAIGDLLAGQMQAVLATVSAAGEPALHLMAYAFSPSLETVYLASYDDTLKVANMRANPQVKWLWDNRTGSAGDHIHGFAVTASGSVTELIDSGRREAASLLLARNRSLQKMLENPHTVVFATSISRYSWIQGYGKVDDFEPTSKTK